MTHRRVCVLTDNKALISRIKNWNTKGLKEVLAPEFDLLQAAHAITVKHDLHILPAHVKSHQDDGKAYKDLSWQARMNCNCDTLAETARHCEQCRTTAHSHYILPRAIVPL
jgi:hypothetical protein